MLFLFPYFAPKLFCFLCIRLLPCPRTFSTCLLEEFSFVILEWPILFLLLHFVSVSFDYLFFHQNLLIYLFKPHYQTCMLFCFGRHILGCFSFLRIFAYSRNFFCCPSCLISPPGFVFLFVFFRGTPILSQTCFALTFGSVMLTVRIFSNNLFLP